MSVLIRKCGAGFGNHLAMPLFREKHSKDMTEADAVALLQEALKVSLVIKHYSISLGSSLVGEGGGS